MENTPVPGELYYQSNVVEIKPLKEPLWRSRPQTVAMITASMLFITAGMEMALGIAWNQNTHISTSLQFKICWSIGIIAGALIAAPLVYYLPKRLFFGFSGLLVLASGIIYVSAPYKYPAIIAARYVSGIAIGLAIVAFIVQGSELGSPTYRGVVLSTEQASITFGICIQVIYTSQWTPNLPFAENRVHGIFVIFFAVVSLVAVYLTIESPIYYIRKCDDVSALECLRLRQRPKIITPETKLELDELKAYVFQEDNQPMAENILKSLNPLVKALLYRSMVAFSFSPPLNDALQVASYVSIGYANNWTPIVFSILRVVGAFVALWIIDNLGRKNISLLALLIMGGLILGVGIICSDGKNLHNKHQMMIAYILAILSQLFAGLFASSTTVYLGEAFPLVLKPYLAAFCVIIAQVIQIVTGAVFNFSMFNEFAYCIAVGVIVITFVLYFFLTLPETMNTTLNEAQKRFRKMLNLK